MQELHEQLDKLETAYSDNEYVLGRMKTFIMQQLPSYLEHAEKTNKERTKRKERLSEHAELVFKCSGGFAQAEVRRGENDGSMQYIQKKTGAHIIQGEFSLKNLGYFIKCTNLCSNIEMYLENELPLVVKYNVASLGEIKLCLAPLPSQN